MSWDTYTDLANRAGYPEDRIDRPGQECADPDCDENATYWYIALGRRVGYCFAHATVQMYTSGHYGYRERK